MSEAQEFPSSASDHWKSITPLSWQVLEHGCDSCKRTDQSHSSCVLVGGCCLARLVDQLQSPTYVYCEQTLRSLCQSFRVAFDDAYDGCRVEFSSKAFPSPAMAALVHSEGLRIDVVSGGELASALAGGVPGSLINFHGNNKSRQELAQALAAGVHRITIDSFHELALLDELARAHGQRQGVLLRLSPSVDPHTHLLTTTGVLDSKFGFSIETGAAEEAIQRALQCAHLELVGVHFHLGSPLFELEPFTQAIEYTLAFVATMRARHGFELREFSPGGGFAVAYCPEQHAPSPQQYAATISSAVTASCAQHGLPLPLLTVEPGRALTARACVALYTVGGTKHVEGVRTFVSVDGGMGDNIRPALYGARYSALSVSQPCAPASQLVTLVGKFCESGDYLCRDVRLPVLQPDEVLAVPVSGAYNLCMASNYNMAPRPAVVFVRDGAATLVERRESLDDLLRRHCHEPVPL